MRKRIEKLKGITEISSYLEMLGIKLTIQIRLNYGDRAHFRCTITLYKL